MRYISFIFLLLIGTLTTQAQLHTVPLNENTVLKENAHLIQPAKIKKGGGIIDTIDIPFLDDFSYEGPYPDCKLWVDKSTYINSSIAIKPPTIGVATFDGVNQFGAPYGNSGQGSADTLTSMPLKLAGKTSASNIRLSFFYEPKGYGDKPGVNDSLYVELKMANDTWVKVWSYSDTTSSLDEPTFNFVSIPISGSVYFYDGFQFRFRNLATLTGQRDLWHIDYVRVTEGQVVNEVLNDVAFTQPPVSIFNEYTAMPWQHFETFEDDELASQNQIFINNHFNTTQFVGPANFIVNENLGIATSLGLNILNLATPPLNGNIPVGLNQIDSVINTTEYSLLRNHFVGNYQNQNIEDITFTLQINMNPGNQQANVPSIVRNDTIKRDFVFDDYFAYDDGTAETAVAAGRIGDQFAVRYHTNIDDTLKAVRINIPRLSGTITNQRINLKIWLDDLNSTPIYQENFIKATYVDSINAWTTYSLDTSLIFIPGGSTFFIGWQQATTPPSISRSFLIGYDRNSPKGFANIFQNVSSSWEKLDTVSIQPKPGSIMIRPVFGKGTYFTTPTVEVPQPPVEFNLFPNPTRDRLNIQLKNNDFDHYEYRVYNSIGVMLQANELSSSINTSDFPNGWYILQVIDKRTGQAQAKKFMIIQ